MAKRPEKPADKSGAADVKGDVAFPIGNINPNLLTTSALIAQILQTAGATAGPAATAITPGTITKEIPIGLAALRQLLITTATQDSQTEVWVQGPSELQILSSQVNITLDDGLAIVVIPVSCDQTQNQVIQVPFALGGKDSPAGMVLATETRPRGPDIIVDLWGEALIAYAWRLLMMAAVRVAAQSGADADGAGLVPISLAATKESLNILPMARHSFDRVRL